MRELPYPPAHPVLWEARSLNRERPGRTRVYAQMWVNARELAAAELGVARDEVELTRPLKPAPATEAAAMLC